MNDLRGRNDPQIPRERELETKPRVMKNEVMLLRKENRCMTALSRNKRQKHGVMLPRRINEAAVSFRRQIDTVKRIQNEKATVGVTPPQKSNSRRGIETKGAQG